MFFRRSTPARRPTAAHRQQLRAIGPMIEGLENRQLLSATATVHHSTAQAVKAHHVSLKHSTTSNTSTSSSTSGGGTTTTGSGGTLFGRQIRTITFSQAPAKVQSGLLALASTDNVTAPTSSTKVYLSNQNGVESYSIVATSTGTTSRLTVDQNGDPVTTPAQTTTTWATLSGSGTDSDTVASGEISAIATALNLTAPTSTTTVNVSTASSGAVTYSVLLADASGDERRISVDAKGNPVGNQQIPFSVLPAVIRSGINSHLPTGATALASSSTQTVDVATLNGVTTYSTSFTVSGTTTKVTVDSTGALANLPSQSSTTFSAIPLAAQKELQTLATADGVSGTISSTQAVTAYDEGNGTIVYSVTLTATDSTAGQSVNLSIAVDQAGNPTVIAQGNGHGGGCGSDGGAFAFGGNDASGAGLFQASAYFG